MPRVCFVAPSLAELTRAGLDFLFPQVCVGCGRLGHLFCPACAQAVTPVPLPCCPHCGRPQSTSNQGCPDCRRNVPDPLTFVRAAALHTHPLREAIHAFKYEGRPELGPLLARYLVAVLARTPWDGAALDAVIPIPLHPERLAERGYNQAERLTASLCAVTGLHHAPHWLERARLTRQQVGLGPAERHANVDGAFTAAPDMCGKHVLLVDDVCTTGATLRACAQAARAAGALAVYGLTLALPPRSDENRI